MKEVGARLQEYLEKKGIQKKTFMKEVGLSQGHLYGMFKGKNFSLEILFRINDKYPDLTPCYLLNCQKNKENTNTILELENDKLQQEVMYKDMTIETLRNTIEVLNETVIHYKELNKVKNQLTKHEKEKTTQD